MLVVCATNHESSSTALRVRSATTRWKIISHLLVLEALGRARNVESSSTATWS